MVLEQGTTLAELFFIANDEASILNRHFQKNWWGIEHEEVTRPAGLKFGRFQVSLACRTGRGGSGVTWLRALTVEKVKGAKKRKIWNVIYLSCSHLGSSKEERGFFLVDTSRPCREDSQEEQREPSEAPCYTR